MSKRSVVDMTSQGLASVMGSGKVRWWPFDSVEAGAGTNKDKLNADATRTIVASGGGAIVTALCLSKDSQWLAIARQTSPSGSKSAATASVSVLKLKGGDGTEIQLGGEAGFPSLSTVRAMHVESSKKGNAVVRLADETGLVLSWTAFANGSAAQPHVLARDLGEVSSLTVGSGEIFLARNGGVTVSRLNTSTGQEAEEPGWPIKTATPPVKKLLLSQEANLLAVASQHRHIHLHPLDNPSTSHALASDAVPVSVDFNQFRPAKTDSRHFLALTESGIVSVWKYPTQNASTTPLPPVATIKIDAPSKTNSIHSAKFISSTELLVSFGNLVKPQVQKIAYVNKKDEFVKETILSSDKSSGVLLATNEPTTPQTGGKSDRVKVLGPGDTRVATVFDKTGDSFADRLNRIGEAPPEKATMANMTAAATAAIQPGDSAPKATTAVTVLITALSSNDSQQLGLVLSQTDPRVITATVKALPIGMIMPLLTELMQRFSRKPSLNSIAWLRAVLITHQSYLTSLPNLLDKLSGLYNNLDDRLKHFPELLKLSGRFDLLVAQVASHSIGTPTMPLNTYIEGEEDEEDDDYEDSSDGEKDGQDQMDDEPTTANGSANPDGMDDVENDD